MTQLASPSNDGLGNLEGSVVGGGGIFQQREDFFNIKLYKKLGAEDRNQTLTVVTYRRILSPVRLPVPPPRQNWSGRRDSKLINSHLGKVVFYH